MDIAQILQQNFHYVLLALFLFLLFKNRILAKIYGIESISAQQAFADFKRPAKSLFLDIRTKWELDTEPRIKISKTIPLSELPARMDELTAKTEQRKIIVVCRSGHRAIGAAIKLKKAGLNDVAVMSGGMIAWQRQDYPLLRPKKNPKRTYG